MFFLMLYHLEMKLAELNAICRYTVLSNSMVFSLYSSTTYEIFIYVKLNNSYHIHLRLSHMGWEQKF